MPINLYFDTVFAQGGTVVTVPDGTQSDGSVSYNQGYGPFYTQDPAINPTTALDIEETKMNQIFQDITSAIQFIQQNGCAAFITTAMNGGTPYSYNQGATVVQSGIVYFSLVGSNTTTPPSSSWAPLSITSIIFYGGTTAGTVNAQTATAASFTKTAGNSVFVIFGNTNTGALQLNITGTGLTNAYKSSASGPIPCTGGEAVTGNIGLFTFDGTEYQFMNPQPVSSTSAIQSLIDVEFFTSSGSWTKPTGCNAVEVIVIGAGGGGGAFNSSSSGVTGGTTTFGSVAIATGGTGGNGGSIGGGGGNPGSGTTGTFSQSGSPGFQALTSAGGAGALGGINYFGYPGYGNGGGGGGGSSPPGATGGGGGGSGGYDYLYMASATLGSTVTVTIGAGGTGNPGPGASGLCIVKSYK